VPAVVHVPVPIGQSAFEVHPTSSSPLHTRHGHSVPGGDVHGRLAPIVCDAVLNGWVKTRPLPLMFVIKFGGQSWLIGPKSGCTAFVSQG
jgi:hypothetical protein